MKRLGWLGALLLAAGGAVLVAMRGCSSAAPPPSQARLEALRDERDKLQNKLRDVVVARGERSLAQAPPAGLMIGLPVTFTSSILEQVVTGLFGETILTLENLRVHTAGEVKAKILFAKRTIGEYVLDVRIHQVQGVLKPGKPTLAFGGNRVDVELPVQLAGGEGNADLRFRWNSKGLADVVCGDVDITRRITGGVVPEDYQVGGASPSRPWARRSSCVRSSPTWRCASSSTLRSRRGASWTLSSRTAARAARSPLIR